LLEIIILNTAKYVGGLLKSAWAMGRPSLLLPPGTAKHAFLTVRLFHLSVNIAKKRNLDTVGILIHQSSVLE